MSKKMKWVCTIGATVLLTALLSMCSGGSDKKSSNSDENQSNESRKMEVSTLKLKGPHASLIKVEEPYVLSLVKTPDEGWQVRVKINFVKAKEFDGKRYQPQLHCCRNCTAAAILPISTILTSSCRKVSTATRISAPCWSRRSASRRR